MLAVEETVMAAMVEGTVSVGIGAMTILRVCSFVIQILRVSFLDPILSVRLFLSPFLRGR
jgi:hypothetical protein